MLILWEQNDAKRERVRIVKIVFDLHSVIVESKRVAHFEYKERSESSLFRGQKNSIVSIILVLGSFDELFK